ncbi:MAG: fumarylacetoacetate hydrolase family protein [Asticcacaulis sp.]|uniref:fumarylacetoacetate hydrolase family protein n=1 Tax=Asticcacaulis sp. TaxID=1872648 RepID=UPI0039E676ED
MIAGNIYGIVLNDSLQRPTLTEAFMQPPYKAPPEAPVLYIKSRNCLMPGPVWLEDDLTTVEVAATLGLLIGTDATRVSRENALSHVGGICLALDISEPNASYYRPSVRQRCRDGFLPLGRPLPLDDVFLSADIETLINGQPVHTWSLKRLVRDAATLIADMTSYMTLSAGDLLLIGLAGDAPQARRGDTVTVTARGLPPLTVQIQREAKA